MAEIGDITRFTHKGALVCYAGLEPPEYQSGSLRQQTEKSLKQVHNIFAELFFRLWIATWKTLPQMSRYTSSLTASALKESTISLTWQQLQLNSFASTMPVSRNIYIVWIQKYNRKSLNLQSAVRINLFAWLLLAGLITDIFNCRTDIIDSCLHFGQNRGKFSSMVSFRILSRVLLAQIGHNSQSTLSISITSL